MIELESGFLDSLVYVMLPSLFSFFALFWAFYALHSYTADQKNMAKVWSRVDRTRQSIRSGFNKSGKNIDYIIGEKSVFSGIYSKMDQRTRTAYWGNTKWKRSDSKRQQKKYKERFLCCLILGSYSI